MNFKFKDTGDHFICTRPNTSAQNIILGTTYVDTYGDMEMQNLWTKDRVKVKLIGQKGSSMWNKKDAYEISGKINGQSKIYGHWNESLFFQKSSNDEPIELWKRDEVPDDFEDQYQFTHFTRQLNNLDDELLKILPPTDSRLRHDLRHLENGNLTGANEEKHLIEEIQRAQRKEWEETGEIWKPRYFKEVVYDGGDKEYLYINDYWEDRETGEWSQMKDIFGI